MTSPAAVASDRRVYSAVQKDAATFIELEHETGRTVADVELWPGGGNAPHIHPTFEEHFEVLEGELTVRLGKEFLTLGVGETALVPRGAVHCFENRTDAMVRFRVTLSPGHRGFEETLQIGYGLATDGKTRADGMPKNLLIMGLLGEMSEFVPVGPARMILPFVKPLAWMARRRGLDVELRERYVRF